VTPERARPLVHVGYHKTGTTWLQTGLFADETAGFARPWDSKAIRDALVLVDPFDFDVRDARRAFEPGLADAGRDGLVAVVSDERLSGSPHAGGFDAALVAERIASVFPEGRVLMVIREQVAAIHSVYKQYLRDGGGARLDAYLHPRRTAEIPQFRFEHFAYDRPIRRYRELLGPERFRALPFELLARDERSFVDAILELAGLPTGSDYRPGGRYPALGSATLALKRWANLLLVRTSLSPAAPLYVMDHEHRFERIDRLVPRSLSRRRGRRERTRIAEAVGDRYAESNRRTAELAGHDLAEWGYRT